MIGRKSTLIALNTIVGGLLGLAAIKAITYWVSPTYVGQFSIPFGVLGMMYFVTDLGIGQAHVKRVSEGRHEGDCFTTYFVFKIASTLAFVLIALAVYVYQYQVRGVGFEDLSVSAYFIFMAYFAVSAFRTAFQSTFDARREAARSQLVLFTDTAFRVGAVLLVTLVFAAVTRQTGLLAGHVTADAWWARLIAHYPSGALAATFLVGMIASVLVAWREWARSRVEAGTFRWSIMKDYATFALPLFLLGVASTLSGFIDRVALGFFGTAIDAGVFEPVKRFSLAIEAIPIAVALLLFPSVSAMQAQGNEAGIRDATEKSLRYVSMIVLPMVAFVAFFPVPLVRIVMSADYASGALALSLLVAYSFIVGLQRPYFALITGLGHVKVTARVGITMALSNVVLNVLLIPDDIKVLGVDLPGLKVTGAALATLLSGLIGFVMLKWSARHIIGPVRVRGFVRHVIATGVMSGVLLAMDRVPALTLDRWFDLGLYGAVGASVYFLVLAALREFTRRDLELFLDLANAREMWRYVRGELKKSDK